jgi:quercetin dioxygenase-like cupin family protein
VIAKSGEGQTWTVLGETVTCKAGSADTNGAYSLFEVVSPARGGAPLHIHRREDEAFYVLEGNFRVQAGGDLFNASAGSFVHFTKGIPHTYRNIGTRPGRLLVVATPAGYENFFEGMSQLNTADGPPDMTRATEVAARYGIEIIGPPLAS